MQIQNPSPEPHPRDLSKLHTDDIKRILKQELCVENRNVDLLDHYTMAMCRDCEFGLSSDTNILECEKVHHESIQRAVLQNEREHTLYFLNNLKSVVITKIKVNVMNCQSVSK